jgi:hypothetical protein
MATETTSADVRVVFTVVDKASAAIQDISKSLEGVAQANEDLQASVPRSMADQAKAFGYAWDPEKVLPQLAPEIEKQVAAVGIAMGPMKEHIAGLGATLRTFFTDLGTGIREKLGGALKDVSGWASGVAGSLKTAFAPLSTVLLGVAGGAITTFVELASQGIDEIVKDAKRLDAHAKAVGVTADAYQDLTTWMRRAGGTSDQLDKSLLRLTRGLGAVKEGGKGSKSIAEVLESFNIHVGATTQTADILPQLAQGFAGLTDASERARRGFILFGAAWEKTVEQLRKGPEEFAKAREEAEKLGKLSQKQIDDALAYAKSQEHLEQSMKSTREAIGSQMLPMFTQYNEQMATFTDQNREAIAIDFSQGVKAVADFVTSTKQEIVGIQHAWEGVKVAVVDAYTTIKGYTDTPLSTIWADAGNTIAAAWEKVKAIPPEAWVAGSVPGVPPPPPAPAAGMPALGGPPPSGTVNVNINNQNPPPGQTVEATATGAAKIKNVDVGKSMPWSQPDYHGPWAPAAG